MKFQILVFFLLTAVAAGATGPVSSITFRFTDAEGSLRLQVGEKTVVIKPEENGVALFKAEIATPQYVKLMRSQRPELLFLFPNEDLEVIIKGPEPGQLAFTGRHASINEYLVDPKSIYTTGNFTLGEKEYTDFLTTRVGELQKKVEAMGFDPRFVEKEKKRIAAKTYTFLVTYPSMRKRTERTYRPSEAYMNFIKANLFEDPGMLQVDEYTGFIQYMYTMLATREIEKYDPFVYAKANLEYVVKNIQNNKIKSHLVNFYAYDFLKRNGTEQAEPITAIFKKYVKDREKIEIYENTWETWSKLTPGRLLPDMVFYDISGHQVRLSSLRGKYVYIDVWATWCKPCIAEIPNLKKMEQALEGKKIVFVSISTDKDADAWKKMVEKDNFTGNQWHARTREFSNELMIVSIPRFILIDPQGKIVDANVWRPNRPETYELMKTLPTL